MAKLYIQQPEGDQLLTDLANDQAYIIGRGEDCTICIPTDSVSGHHAQLAPTNRAGSSKTSTAPTARRSTVSPSGKPC
jgi:hypothetical protein